LGADAHIDEGADGPCPPTEPTRRAAGREARIESIVDGAVVLGRARTAARTSRRKCSSTGCSPPRRMSASAAMARPAPRVELAGIDQCDLGERGRIGIGRGARIIAKAARAHRCSMMHMRAGA
jgi:hypothetical protein